MTRVLNKTGLDGVLADESAICLIDEEQGCLRYRGYAVEDLAEQASFEEVAYLLIKGDLPTGRELDEWNHALAEARHIPDRVGRYIRDMASFSHPMDFLRTGVSLLGISDPESNDPSHEANVRKTIKLMARIPMLMAWLPCCSLNKIGAPPSPSQEKPERESVGVTMAETLLYSLTGTRDSAKAKELDVSLNLYAEHEFNASTFAARVTASTLADLYGAVVTAIATLKGPLHGGANEGVATMLLAIGRPDKAEEWVHATLARKDRVMGFGHRVLKQEDPRSMIMKRRAGMLSEELGEMKWFEMAETIERTMRREKGLLPNLDFYTAVAYLLLGIPLEAFTPIFVASRVVGWCAHIIEQQDHNRLIRPRAVYIGPEKRAYFPLRYRLSGGRSFANGETN